MKINLKKNYRWLLVAGIILLIINIVLSIFFYKVGSIEDNTILGRYVNENGWLLLLSMAIVAPFVEEFTFRSWTIKKKWTKYLCLVLSPLTIALVNVFVGIIYALAMIATIFLLEKKPKAQIYSYIIITSIGFAFAHIGNMELANYILNIPIYLGFAFILSYIALRFKFRYAIITHGLINFTILIGGGFIIPYGSSIALNGGNYKGNLIPVSGLSFSFKDESIGNKTIECNRKVLSRVASSLIKLNSDFETKTYTNGINFYNLNIVSKDSNNIDMDCLLKEIVKKGKLRLDTISETKTAYFLSVKDINKQKKDGIAYYQLGYKDATIEFLAKDFAKTQNIVVRVPEQLKNKIIRYNTSFNSSNDPSSVKLSKALKNFEAEYGLIFTPKQAEVKTIRIFEE